ncbi:AAA family ATPase [Halobacillus campisalis]|uniref:AAA family ATPase n=1 Tax=Halobacillus campisalis TaxID=435909 RepID=A0ABW2K6B5_9BACI|nr:AAA family ATPase [Halobacillus campisalis]
MQIRYVDIQNFRKLKSCRIEFADEKTVLVGANNSGKTTAMDALKKFLIKGLQRSFSTTDFTLSNWIEINKIGDKWEEGVEDKSGATLSIDDWEEFLPSLDLWLRVEENELHHVTHLIPSLDWDSGYVGVRIRFEPKDLKSLFKGYTSARMAAKEAVQNRENTGPDADLFELSPQNMRSFLEENLLKYFVIRSYTLDSNKLSTEHTTPQILGSEIEPTDGNPLTGLIRIDYISAQRGFTDPDNKSPYLDDDNNYASGGKSLSSQLRTYYNTHLNPEKLPDASDIGALEAIHNAQRVFDLKLKEDFKDAIQELETLGYPGFSNPKITISTQVKPMNNLDHKSAVQYDLLSSSNADSNIPMRLPESHNGLGYQNLISMVFKLMSFRDDWMQVGKVAKEQSSSKEDYITPPLHLVFIEEPEAHLHAQVQQVFIRKAYEVLRSHKDLGTSRNFTTQMVVSTHSSHIAHETEFSSLRYFKKQISHKSSIPISTVENLSEVFGRNEATNRFVTRYIKSVHCDLFFADAVILVEGPAERMLVPQFIENDSNQLYESYISILEIGGSHAHRLQSLIEKLGIHCLIITDLDCIKSNSKKAIFPERNKGYLTDNYTLKNWLPKLTKIDDLLNLDSDKKVLENNGQFIRVAYQTPMECSGQEALATTFEDALAFENINFFQNNEGIGLLRKFKESIDSLNGKTDNKLLSEKFFNSLRETPKKAEFALDIIYSDDFERIKTPSYITEGLKWLEEKVSLRNEHLSISEKEYEVIK